jgi:hypothetical protein
MQFGHTIGFAVSEDKILIGKILDVTDCEMTGIGSGVNVQRLREAAKRGCRPMRKTLGDRFIRSRQKKRNCKQRD